MRSAREILRPELPRVFPFSRAKGLKLYLQSHRFAKLIITFSLYIPRASIFARRCAAVKSARGGNSAARGGGDPGRGRGNIEVALRFFAISKVPGPMAGPNECDASLLCGRFYAYSQSFLGRSPGVRTHRQTSFPSARWNAPRYRSETEDRRHSERGAFAKA